MIDTIVLTVMANKFNILDHNKFNPSTIGLFKPPFYSLGGRGTFKCVKNPLASDLINGNYKPRLTVLKRIVQGGFQVVLRIEFSIPKLIYGNNFDEVTALDFMHVVKTLHSKLLEMSVLVHENDLISATVSSIHYSKNIILTDGSTPKMIIDELRKANMSLVFDTEQTNYRNEGCLLKYHTNSFELVFYDKVKDLEQAKISEKRAIEKDNSLQLGLFTELKTVRKKKPFEVLRVEFRFNTPKKITSELEAVAVKKSLTFKDLFDPVVSKAILLRHWYEFTKPNPIADQRPRTYAEYLTQTIQLSPKMPLSKALRLAGTKVVVDEIGLRGYRNIISKFGKEAWYRIKNEFEQSNLPRNPSVLLPNVEKQLQEFKPTKMSAYGVV